jgi:Flp pilus assembly protein TadG
VSVSGFPFSFLAVNTITVTITTPGALGTSIFAVSVNGGTPVPQGNTAASFNSAVGGLVFYFTPGSYNTTQSWTWNFGVEGAFSADAFVADVDVVDMPPTSGPYTLAGSMIARAYQAATLIMPANPWDGMQVGIHVLYSAVTFTNQVTIQANTGQTIENPYQLQSYSTSGGSFPLFVQNQLVIYRWNANIGSWTKSYDNAEDVWPSIEIVNNTTVNLPGRALVRCSSGTASPTVNLPTATCNGIAVGVKDIEFLAATHNINVNAIGSGWQIEYPKATLASTAALAVNGIYAEWVSDTETKVWWLKGLV